MNVNQKVLETIKRYAKLRSGDRVLVAVSGGPDSLFLLHVLLQLKKKLEIKIFVAHLDHGVRGKKSREDAIFVKKIAKRLKIDCITEKSSPLKKKMKISSEEALRAKRYEFLKKTARKIGIKIIATAHSLDDQAETVLMRIIKGSSLKGLIGIHPIRIDSGVRYIRPIIEVEKKDILEYLERHAIDYRIDHTNYDEKYLRNKVRRKVLPYLEKINPKVKRSLSNLADTLREDYEYIEGEKRKAEHIIKSGRNTFFVALKDILLQPRALRKEITREAIKKTGANVKKLTFRHWKDIDKCMRDLSAGASLDLPGGVRMLRDAENLIFSARGAFKKY